MAVTDSRGYRKVYVGKDHPMAQATGYAYEHRLKKAEAEGRVLSPEELVHHDDEITGNNELDNLEITSRPEHVRIHNPRLGTGRYYCGRGHERDPGVKCRECERQGERARYVPTARDPATMLANGRHVGAITAARQKAKTHCPSGHPYDRENTKIKGNRRVCKTCARAYAARKRGERLGHEK
jgi:hypothetical protein